MAFTNVATAVAAAFMLRGCSAQAQAVPGAEAFVAPATGNRWVCGHEAFVVWEANPAVSPDTPVSFFIGPEGAGNVAKLTEKTTLSGDMETTVALDCEALGIVPDDFQKYTLTIAAKGSSEALAVTAPFTVGMVGVISPMVGSSLTIGKVFNFTWVSGQADPVPATIEVFGRPAEGEPVLLAAASNAVAAGDTVQLRLPTKASAFPAVFFRVTSLDQAEESVDYPMTAPRSTLGSAPEAETQCLFCFWRFFRLMTGFPGWSTTIITDGTITTVAPV